MGTEALSPVGPSGTCGRAQKLSKFDKKIIALVGFDDYDKSFVSKD